MLPPLRMSALVTAVIVVGCLGVPTAALALSDASAQADFTYGPGAASSSGPASAQNGTGMEAESKLFYTADGSWWGVLGTDNPVAGVFLYHLVNDQWQQVLLLPGSDPWMKSDVFYDAATSKLYVALRDSKAVGSDARISELYTLTQGADGAWTVTTGPTQITKKNPRNLTIALDSLGRVWTTYETGNQISVGNTQPGASSFSFANLPASAVTSKDTSAVVSFGTSATGYKIGVMWDDTVTQRYMFAWRYDSDPIGSSYWHIETAYGDGVGGCPTLTTSACANYHISLRAIGDDIYAAVKLMSQDSPNKSDPLIVLVHRDPLGLWSASTVSIVSQNSSRQILLLAPSQNHMYVVAENGKSGLYAWESPLDVPAFDPLVVSTWSIPHQNLHSDPTSTKQSLGADGAAVVESSQGMINQYWRNEFSAF